MHLNGFVDVISKAFLDVVIRPDSFRMILKNSMLQ